MTQPPLVSVIMPVYNGERYLCQAVESILKQTFFNFEFIIIDDGSRDSSPDILSQLSVNDPRIRLITLERNQGIVNALNTGLSEAKGQYIARMDCDDISDRSRFQKQIDYLQHDQDVGIVGTNLKVIDSEGRYLGLLRYPQSDPEIRWKMILYSPFAHPSIMVRRSILVDHNLYYREDMKNVEDYSLWSDLLRYTNGSNIPDPLIKYRIHPQSVSRTVSDQDWANRVQISHKWVQYLFPDVHIEYADLYKSIRSSDSTELEFRPGRPAASLFILRMGGMFLSKYKSEGNISKVKEDLILTVFKFGMFPYAGFDSIRLIALLFLQFPDWLVIVFPRLKSLLESWNLHNRILRASSIS